MILRDYQQECILAMQQGLDRGVSRQLAVLPTGAGKTVILSEAARVIPGRTLVIAHREELVVQNGKKLIAANPASDVGMEQGERYCHGAEDIVTASVQTLSRNECKRLRRLLRYGYFEKVIFDEAHHASATSYLQVLQCLREYNSDVKVFGFTATPKRSDGIGLEKVFQEVVYTMTIRDAIERGYLVDIVAEKILTETSLDGIHSKAGDYKESELSERINTDERNSKIVKGWLDHANGKQTIVFCVNVEHAQNVNDLFCRQGVKAEMVIGETDSFIRRSIIDRFKSGRTTVLVNVNVLTEGFDDSGIQCILMARPTKSQLVYIQQLGRGTRPAVDLTGLDQEARIRKIESSKKPSLHLLDIVDNCTTHSPVMLAELFGVPKDIKLHKTPIVKAAKKLEDALKQAPNLRLDKVKDIEKLQQLVTKALSVKIWDIEPPKEVKDHSRLSWLKQGDEYRLQLDKDQVLFIRQNALGQYETVAQSKDGARVLGHEDTLQGIFNRSDKFVENNYEDKVILLAQNAKWKKDIATDKQVGFLRRIQHPVRSHNGEHQIYDGQNWIRLTKGLAAGLITKFLNGKQPKADAQSGQVKTHVLHRTVGSVPAMRQQTH